MTDKLGALLCWLLYLGMVRWVAREVLPFLIAILALTLVFGLIIRGLKLRL